MIAFSAGTKTIPCRYDSRSNLLLIEYELSQRATG
jgi:hypothetical protein